jgi:PAS domain S-box-containing protein
MDNQDAFQRRCSSRAVQNLKHIMTNVRLEEEEGAKIIADDRVDAPIGYKRVPYQRETVGKARARPLPACKPILRAADQRADLKNATTVLACDASAMELLVGLTAPFRIHGADSAFLDTFQLSAATCISRSLSLVQGPETNVKVLFSLFETARVGRGANAMIMFYSSSGNGHLFHVAVEPQSSQGDVPESCIISLVLVQATPLKDAVLPDGRAKVIVSAESRTVHVSPEFEKMYGYLWSEIAGRTLGFITGPNTNMALLRQLLNSARNGHSESASFFTNNRAGHEILTVIQVKPVVDGGVVSHMVVVCSIVGDIGGHCLHDQTNDREWGTDELHVERLVEMSYRKPSDAPTPLSSSHADWGWEALQ